MKSTKSHEDAGDAPCLGLRVLGRSAFPQRSEDFTVSLSGVPAFRPETPGRAEDLKGYNSQ